MKTFTLKLDCTNESFHLQESYEICRILREVARRIERGEDFSHFRTIFDSNGNDVGRFALKMFQKNLRTGQILPDYSEIS